MPPAGVVSTEEISSLEVELVTCGRSPEPFPPMRTSGEGCNGEPNEPLSKGSAACGARGTISVIGENRASVGEKRGYRVAACGYVS